MIQNRRRAGGGFSLIEVLVAISIFAILTVGLIPLLAMSLKGATVSQSYTQAKALVQRSLENARGLPYFVTGTRRTDILDLYFPDLATGSTVTTTEAGSVVTGYNSTSKTYTTACTTSTSAPTGSGPAACPHAMPNGISAIPPGRTIVFQAQFLDRSLAAIAPATGYAYSSATTAPSSLLKLTVTAYWTIAGQSRNFSVATLIGARKLNTETIRAESKTDYLVQILTGYNDADGSQSALTATMGASDSQLSTKAISTSDQSVATANATLTQADFQDTQGSVIGSIEGATSTMGAPPNSSSSAVTNTGATLGPGLPTGFFTTPLSIAGFTANRVDSASTQITSDLPQSAGAFSYTGALGSDSFWVTNQANPAAYMQLDPTQPMVSIDKGLSSRSSGSTNATSTAITPAASRKVETTVTGDVKKISIMPTGFICNGVNNPTSCTSGNTSGERSVLVISNFHEALDCKATSSTTVPAVASGSWSATVSYWNGVADPSNPTQPTGYVNLNVGGSTTSSGADPFATLKTTNPLVFDSPTNSQDVYLFAINGQKGYLSDMSSVVAVPSSRDALGTNTTVTLDGAIHINTAPTDPSLSGNNPTGIAMTVGKSSCQARDNRG